MPERSRPAVASDVAPEQSPAWLGIAVGLLVGWNTRRDHRLLGVALAVILLAGGAWELERRIVTESERLELLVLDLRDAVQDKEVLEVLGFFSNCIDFLMFF